MLDADIGPKCLYLQGRSLVTPIAAGSIVNDMRWLAVSSGIFLLFTRLGHSMNGSVTSVIGVRECTPDSQSPSVVKDIAN